MMPGGSLRRRGTLVEASVVITLCGALATVLLTSLRAGFATRFGLSVWDLGIDVQAVLASAALAATLLSWILGVLALLFRSIFSGPRGPKYVLANLIMVAVALAASLVFRNIAVLSGDAAAFASWTAVFGWVGLAAALVSSGLWHGIETIGKDGPKQRQQAILLASSLILVAGVQYFRPPLWTGLIPGTAVLLGLGVAEALTRLLR